MFAFAEAEVQEKLTVTHSNSLQNTIKNTSREADEIRRCRHSWLGKSQKSTQVDLPTSVIILLDVTARRLMVFLRLTCGGAQGNEFCFCIAKGSRASDLFV